MSTSVAAPPTLAPRSSEVGFVFQGPQTWAVAWDSLSTGDSAHREETLPWSPSLRAGTAQVHPALTQMVRAVTAHHAACYPLTLMVSSALSTSGLKHCGQHSRSARGTLLCTHGDSLVRRGSPVP